MKSENEPLKLEDLEIYQLAMEVGEFTWQLVSEWAYFDKGHPGNQFLRAADSIAANIAEGHGRYFFKEKKQFSYYARGSLLETKTWLTKAHKRNLISDAQSEALTEKLKTLHYKINSYIKNLKDQ
ncbi:MAG: four helix bundle protein [Saprospiraceae bacterium]